MTMESSHFRFGARGFGNMDIARGTHKIHVRQVSLLVFVFINLIIK